MIATILISLQIGLLCYFSYFAAYNYLYSIASLFNPNYKKTKISGKKVAVIIVSYNENRVLFDTITACEKLSYENKVIIVGDDSNDGITYPQLKKTALRKGCTIIKTEDAEILQSEKFVVIHRFDNKGFKAGNLKLAEKYLRKNNIEYFYLLDADWHPQKDTIEKCLEVLEADSRMAFVQTNRVSHTGNSHLQNFCALNENGCYMVDLPGRAVLNEPILFTGCCTLFRLDALEKVDGFKPGHLTEDIDLTNRLYLEGYKGAYLPYVKSIGEVPPNYKSLRKQQERWTMGSVRAFKDYFWKIIFSKKLNIKEKSGLLRQNSYFTTSVGIEASIILAFAATFLLLAHSDNYQAGLYLHYLSKISSPFSTIVLLALMSNFIPLVITMIKNKEYGEMIFMPFAAFLSWSLVHTYFIANIKGIFNIKQGWFLTPKTNKKDIKVKLESSQKYRIANAVTLFALLFIYGSEWVALGTVDIYAYFWIPALVLGTLNV